MKLQILPLATLLALLISPFAKAQRNSAFAVTAGIKGNFKWDVIREIDLSTGEVLRTIYDPVDKKAVKFSAVAGSELKQAAIAGSATGVGVAATAYDALHDRLYFTGMKTNELMYLDLGQKELSIVVNANPAFNTGNKLDEANVITRMAFGNDGYGYAITNDGKGFLRFTTDQVPTIVNMGQLIDGKENGKISIHNQCSSWGGDMVGDAYGNLYLVSYRNHVFKINPQTRIADYEGQIKGLPAEFTSNGVVVNNDGEVILSSAVSSDNYYKLNMSTLTATALQKKDDKVYNASDLANSNLLFQRKNKLNVLRPEIKGNNAVTITPNPVPNKAFALAFKKVPPGKYNLVLTDAAGRNVFAKFINVNVAGQVENILLPKASAGGLYMIKLIGGDSKMVYTDKLMVN